MKGYAFVELEVKKDSLGAMKELDGLDILGVPVKVQLSKRAQKGKGGDEGDAEGIYKHGWWGECCNINGIMIVKSFLTMTKTRRSAMTYINPVVLVLLAD